MEDYWEVYIDPETGRNLVDGHSDDFWDLTCFVGAEGEEVDLILQQHYCCQ